MPFRLARSILLEVLPLYAAGFLVFLTLTTTDLISSVAGVILRYHAPFPLAAQLYLARLPFLIGEVLPLAVPFAVLIAFGRLARDSELKALYASGVRPLSVLWPLALLGVAVSLLAFFNANVLTPGGNARYDDVAYQVYYRQQLPPPRQDRYVSRAGDTLFYAGSVRPVTGDTTRATLDGVLVQRPEVTYSAQGGLWNATQQSWTFSGYWEVRPGQVPRFHPESLSVPQTDRLRAPSPPPQQLRLGALRAQTRDASLDVRERRAALFEWQRRFADPLTALGFAVAAGALGLSLRNRAWAFASVLLMTFGVWVIWTATKEIAQVGGMPVVLAAWLPNALLLLFAAALAWRLR